MAEALARTVSDAATNSGIYSGDAQISFVLLSLLSTLPLGLLWSQQAAAALAVSAASVLSLTLFHALTVAGLAAQLIVLYRLGRGRSPALAAGLAMPYLLVALADPGHGESRIVTILLASLAPVAAWVGIAQRARGEALEHAAARQIIAGTLIEHTARGERARISRELHDVVAHHISIIAVQAETARLTTPGMPPAGAQRLSSIGDTARTALTEMRRLLGVLREDTESVATDRRPQPGLRQLNELIDAARDSSAACTRLIIRGPLTPLDPGVELAAYRIVQEALTNARRHAPGAAVDVELHYTVDALQVRIRDNGPGPPPAPTAQGLQTDRSHAGGPPAGGHGLLGMRERAAAVGGSLRTSAARGGGFLVEVALPTIEDPAPAAPDTSAPPPRTAAPATDPTAPVPDSASPAADTSAIPDSTTPRADTTAPAHSEAAR
jgi:signal transduction histidine kinase